MARKVSGDALVWWRQRHRTCVGGRRALEIPHSRNRLMSSGLYPPWSAGAVATLSSWWTSPGLSGQKNWSSFQVKLTPSPTRRSPSRFTSSTAMQPFSRRTSLPCSANQVVTQGRRRNRFRAALRVGGGERHRAEVPRLLHGSLLQLISSDTRLSDALGHKTLKRRLPLGKHCESGLLIEVCSYA